MTPASAPLSRYGTLCCTLIYTQINTYRSATDSSTPCLSGVHVSCPYFSRNSCNAGPLSTVLRSRFPSLRSSGYPAARGLFSLSMFSTPSQWKGSAKARIRWPRIEGDVRSAAWRRAVSRTCTKYSVSAVSSLHLSKRGMIQLTRWDHLDSIEAAIENRSNPSRS